MKCSDDGDRRHRQAGSDALAVVKPALEARLEELRAYEDLSKSTDGSFCA
jgi:hypothetical protein